MNEDGMQGTQTHQVNIWHEVAVEGRWDAECPNAISQGLPDVDVEDLANWRAPAARGGIAGFDGHQGLVGEAGQHQHEHEDAEDAHGVVEAHFVQQVGQREGQRDGEGTAAGRHDAVHQSQALLEVVTQDNQTGLVGEGAAAGEHNAVGEVQGAQGPEVRGVQSH